MIIDLFIALYILISICFTILYIKREYNSIVLYIWGIIKPIFSGFTWPLTIFISLCILTYDKIKQIKEQKQ